MTIKNVMRVLLVVSPFRYLLRSSGTRLACAFVTSIPCSPPPTTLLCFLQDLERHLTWSGILKGAGFEGMGRMGEGAKVREEEEEIGWEDDECVVDAPSDVHVL